MDVMLKHNPAFSLAVVRLGASEAIKVEPGAMVGHSSGITVETKSEGGFMGGLKRMVGGESFFQNTYQAPAQGGEISLAPALPGDMVVLEIGGDEMLLQSGAYVASETSITVDTKWGGAKGFFGSRSLILLRVGGRGKVVAACYGALEERVLAAGETYTIDTGHIVAFDADMGFEVRRVGGWKSTLLSGEGFVCDLTGPGRVLLQTRSEESFLGWLLPKLPDRKSN
ncbi:MAG: TIGR00266 family protein [Chloroflexi bacterium]|nr:TIGR00266 family protein [Chloroflexota bacterium]